MGHLEIILLGLAITLVVSFAIWSLGAWRVVKYINPKLVWTSGFIFDLSSISLGIVALYEDFNGSDILGIMCITFGIFGLISDIIRYRVEH